MGTFSAFTIEKIRKKLYNSRVKVILLEEGFMHLLKVDKTHFKKRW